MSNCGKCLHKKVCYWIGEDAVPKICEDELVVEKITPTNTGSLKLPGWDTVECEARNWCSGYESDHPEKDSWVPIGVVKHIYDYISRQLQAGA